MAYVYGTAVGSTLKAFVKYSVVDSPLTYKITIDDFGVYNYSSTYYFDGTENAGDLNSTLSALGESRNMQLIGSIGLTSSQRYINAVDWGIGMAYIPISKTYNKTQSPQNIVVSCTVKIPKWGRRKGKTGTTMASSTATVTATITVPAIDKPAILNKEVLYKRKADSNGDEKLFDFSAKVGSFAGDTVSATLKVNGVSYPLSSVTVPATGIVSFSKTNIAVPLDPFAISFVATGRGGQSLEYKANVSQAFYTMDIGNDGKEIAFGGEAKTPKANIGANGLFTCFMDADFKNGFKANIVKTKTATATTSASGNIGNPFNLNTTDHCLLAVVRTDATSQCIPYNSSGSWGVRVQTASASPSAVANTSVTLKAYYIEL